VSLTPGINVPSVCLCACLKYTPEVKQEGLNERLMRQTKEKRKNQHSSNFLSKQSGESMVLFTATEKIERKSYIFVEER
jgi:hypothetical protein